MKKEYLISLEDIENSEKQMEKNKSYPKFYHSKDNYFRFRKGKDLADFVHVCNPREAAHSKCSVNIAKLNEKLNCFHPFETTRIIHYLLFCNLLFV